MEIKTKTAIISAILAGGLLFGGQAIYEKEIREVRLSLIEQRDFTRNNQEFCRKTHDDRCLDLGEFKQLIKEYNEVKNVEVGGEKKSFEEKLDDKLIK